MLQLAGSSFSACPEVVMVVLPEANLWAEITPGIELDCCENFFAGQHRELMVEVLVLAVTRMEPPLENQVEPLMAARVGALKLEWARARKMPVQGPDWESLPRVKERERLGREIGLGNRSQTRAQAKDQVGIRTVSGIQQEADSRVLLVLLALEVLQASEESQPQVQKKDHLSMGTQAQALKLEAEVAKKPQSTATRARA